jgi:hypothetical protein
MPTQGLSLVGFMEQQQAIVYLSTSCVSASPDVPALLAEWTAAQAKLGPPFPDAGHLTVSQIPQAHDAHIQACRNASWLAQYLQAGWDFRLIEPIDSLLAFQAHVDLDRSQALCSSLPPNPTLADTLPLCLPINEPPRPPVFGSVSSPDPQSLVLKSPSLDFQIFKKLFLPPPHHNLAGIEIGVSPAFVQVVQFNGRYYLRNGFHRTYSLSLRGCSQLPCLFRDENSFQDVAPPGSFPQTLLESPNPPTLGHFSQGRAHNVALRKFSKIIHIGWEQYLIQEE